MLVFVCYDGFGSPTVFLYIAISSVHPCHHLTVTVPVLSFYFCLCQYYLFHSPPCFCSLLCCLSLVPLIASTLFMSLGQARYKINELLLQSKARMLVDATAAQEQKHGALVVVRRGKREVSGKRRHQ